MFLATTAFVLPVEQWVAREVDAGRRPLARRPFAPWTVLALAILVPTTFAAFVRTRLLGDEVAWIAVTAVMMAALAAALVGRGVHTGRRRFDRYAASYLLEGIGRLAVGLAGFLVVGGALGLAWGMAVGPALALLSGTDLARDGDAPAGERAVIAFLGPYVAATASAQALLAGAPLAVAALGAGPAEVSIVFVTFTLLRTPVSLIYPLQGRLLSELLRLRAQGATARVSRLVALTGAAGVGGALVLGALGALVGPAVIALLYGGAFRPGPLLAGLTAAGVSLAIANQLVGQALVAAARTRLLARAWVAGLATAAVVLVAAVLAGPVAGALGAPAARVASAFAAGELATLVLLVAAAGGVGRATGRSDGSPA